MRKQLTKRRGAVLMAALVLLAVILVTAGAMLQPLAATHRAARFAGRKLQAQWLAESALGRAVSKNLTDPDYTGQTWQPPADANGDQGSARIEVQQVDGELIVTIVADFPDHPQHRARAEIRRSIQ